MRDVVPDAGRSNGVVVDSPRADADEQQQPQSVGEKSAG